MSKRSQESENHKRAGDSATSEEQTFRIACDRCHGQKLRCLREEGSSTNGSCKRCHRAGVQCTTSPPRRMGRPLGTKMAKTSKQTPRSENVEQLETTKIPSTSSVDLPMPDIVAVDPSCLWLAQDVFGADTVANGPFTNSGVQKLGSSNPNGESSPVPEHRHISQASFSATSAPSPLSWQEPPPNSWSFTDATFGSANTNINGVPSLGNSMPSWVSDTVSSPSSVASPSLHSRHLSDLLAFEPSRDLENGYFPMFNFDSAPKKRARTLDSSIPPLKFQPDEFDDFTSAIQFDPTLSDAYGSIINHPNHGNLHESPLLGMRIPSPQDSHEAGTDPREACMLQFSRLNLSLYRQLRNIKSGPWSDIYSQHSGTSSPRDGTLDNGTPSFPVGDILTSSQDFLKLLNNFTPRAIPSTVEWAATPRSDSTTSGSLSGFFSSTDLESESACDMIGFESSATCSTTPDRMAGSGGGLQPDTPTILVMLTCYIRLLRIYHTLFTHIHKSILTHDKAFLKSMKIPSCLDLNIGNFKLPENSNLQLIVLVQISVHMLNTIEQTLGISDGGARSTGATGILGDLACTKLMDILLKKEEMDGQEHSRGGLTTLLRSDIKRVKALLKDSLCL